MYLNLILSGNFYFFLHCAILLCPKMFYTHRPNLKGVFSVFRTSRTYLRQPDVSKLCRHSFAVSKNEITIFYLESGLLNEQQKPLLAGTLQAKGKYLVERKATKLPMFYQFFYLW
jgi:hypothetical protein